jgi:UDP-N-acetylmuramoyl-tripeptide--D-alanyl-D-alanine ligase
LEFVVKACGGDFLLGTGQTTVSRVCTDSRQAKAGDLFFALPGEKFDGHDFLREVAAKGAVAVVVEHGKLPLELRGCGIIAVDDSRKALGLLAGAYRRQFSLPIAVVAGSNGKTTTKNLAAAVLRQKLSTLWSEASFNNSIGVPLTLLKLDECHQAAVIEAGTNHPGELAPLVQMIQPKYGLLTGIGREHLEFFGDLAGVAQEEGCLAEMLPADGKLFINGDSEWATQIAARATPPVVRVGLSGENDWRATDIRPDEQGVAFRVTGPRADFNGFYAIRLLGRHQVVNALLVVALAAELGLSRQEIEIGLVECSPAKMRLQLFDLNGVGILDDAYNANADSMLAALQTLADLPCKGRRIAVLGDMAELGTHTEAAQEEAGRRAAELGAAQLFAVGKMAAATARGARAAGLNRIFEFADVDTAGAALRSFVKKGDLVLLKASRAARFERVAELLRAGESMRRT